MKLVDVHCHLESEYYADNLDEIVAQAADVGIIKLITASIIPPQWEQSLSITARYKQVECALGIHPWYIKPQYKNALPTLASLCKDAVAVGEIGLDSKTSQTTLEEQIPFFEDQLVIANEIGLPVIMHCHKTYEPLMRSIKRVGIPKAGGVIHSFNGSSEIASEFMKLGISFSIGGILPHQKTAKRIKLLRTIYPSHFLLETDSPDIIPFEARTNPPSPNVPANIIYNLAKAAEILEKPAEKIAEVTTANAFKIFNLND